MVCFCIRTSFSLYCVCIYFSQKKKINFFFGLFSHDKMYQVRHYLEGFDTLNLALPLT